MRRGRIRRTFSITVLAAASLVKGGMGQEPTVTEVWATKGHPDSLEFTAITGAGFAPDGRIWVSDGPGRILVFSTAGEIQMVVGRRGEGPGEFVSPTLIRASAWGDIVVFDLGRRSLDHFDPSGGFVKRTLLTSTVYNPKGMVVLPDSSVLLSGGITTGQTAIHQFSGEGEAVQSWWPTQDPVGHSRNDFMNARYVAGGPISLAEDGTLLFSESAPHGIFRFQMGDTVPEVVASDPDLLASVLDEFEKTYIDDDGRRVIQPRWFYDQSRSIFSLGNGTIVNTVTFEDRPATMWEAYSPQGELLSRTETPREYWVWDALPDGKVLASYRDIETGEHLICLLILSTG